MKMGDYINFCWQTVENTLPKRMVDDSLIHLLDCVQKKMSTKTTIMNQKIQKLHGFKNYDHYVDIKTKIKEKFNNDTNEYESSIAEDDFNETSSSDMDEEETVERNEQNNQHENEHDTLPKDVSDNLVPVIDVDSQVAINEQKDKLKIDDNSIKSPISNCNTDSIPDDYSNIPSDDEMNELIIDDNPTQNIIESGNGDSIIESSKNSSNDNEENKLEIFDGSTEDLITSLDNDNTMENYSDVLSDDDEKNESETHDHSTEDLKNRPENNCIAENQKKDMQNSKPRLKIIMTEIIEPRYTVISAPRTMLDTTEQFTDNKKSSDELSSSVEKKEPEINRENNFSGQESNNNELDDINSIISLEDKNTTTKKRRLKQKYKRPRRKAIIIPDNYQNSQTYFNKVTNHINSRLESEKKGDSDIATDNIDISEKPNEKCNNENNTSKYPVFNEKAALAYTLDHMAYVKPRQEKLDHGSEFSSGNYTYIENESRGDSNSEQENQTLELNVPTKRPFTLDEFVERSSLISLGDKSSVFTLNDLSDDDELFLMEMPKSIIDQELLGQKMIVRNLNITIGSTHYKLQRLKNDELTCIVKENNERSSFKAVTIKPKGTFAVNKPFVVNKPFEPSIEDNYFDQTFFIGNGRCPFPHNLKVRNPIENNNKRLKKYKKKMRKERKKKLAESMLQFQ